MGASSSASHNDERASSPPPASMPQPLRRPSGASMRASSPALSERRPPLLATALGVDGTRQRRPSAGASSLLSGYGVQQGSMQDTHWYETSVVYQGKMVRLRIPVATFAEEVGEVSLPSAAIRCHAHPSGAVLTRGSALLVWQFDPCRASACASPLQRRLDALSHLALQRNHDVQARHFPRPRTARPHSRKPRTCSLRIGERRRRSLQRPDQASFPVLQSGDDG
jgi:hypothetical protein